MFSTVDDQDQGENSIDSKSVTTRSNNYEIEDKEDLDAVFFRKDF